MTERVCSKQVHSKGDTWHSRQCQRTPCVNVDGKWYCSIHDPKYLKGKQTAWQIAYEARRKRNDEVWAEGQELIEELGFGTVNYDSRVGYNTRELVVPFDKIKELLHKCPQCGGMMVAECYVCRECGPTP